MTTTTTMTMTKPRERRRQLIVDKQLQLRIMVCGAILPFVIFLMIAFILGYYVQHVTATSAVTLPWIWTLLGVCGLFVLLGGTFVAWNLLRLSHRVAGPIFNITSTLAAVRAGDSSRRVRLRKDDYLTAIAAELNSFLDWHEQARRADVRAEVDEQSRAAAAHAEPVASGAP